MEKAKCTSHIVDFETDYSSPKLYTESYVLELETQLKKQQEINKKAIEYINEHWVIDDPVWFKNDLLQILEDKEV